MPRDTNWIFMTSPHVTNRLREQKNMKSPRSHHEHLHKINIKNPTESPKTTLESPVGNPKSPFEIPFGHPQGNPTEKNPIEVIAPRHRPAGLQRPRSLLRRSGHRPRGSLCGAPAEAEIRWFHDEFVSGDFSWWIWLFTPPYFASWNPINVVVVGL